MADSRGGGWLNRAMALALPLAPGAAIWPVAKRYIAGTTMADMLATVQALNAQGCGTTVDLLGEFITEPHEAQATAATYHAILDALAADAPVNNHISIKLSALGLLLDKRLCLGLTEELVSHAQQLGIFVRIDMEDSACTDRALAIYRALGSQYANVGIVLQAYLRRTLSDARALMAEGLGRFRLCKGIYIEPRSVAYTDPAIINRNYEAVLREMLTGGAHVGIATHDEKLVHAAGLLLDELRIPKNQYEFQMLLGVDPQLRQLILDQGHAMRVYVPFGKQWRAYCLRRLNENPKIAGYIFANMLKRGL